MRQILLYIDYIHVATLSVVDCGFQPRSVPTKDYKIGICFYSRSIKEKEQELVGSESG